jgi:hypothetical protein
MQKIEQCHAITKQVLMRICVYMQYMKKIHCQEFTTRYSYIMRRLLLYL